MTLNLSQLPCTALPTGGFVTQRFALGPDVCAPLLFPTTTCTPQPHVHGQFRVLPSLAARSNGAAQPMHTALMSALPPLIAYPDLLPAQDGRWTSASWHSPRPDQDNVFI